MLTRTEEKLANELEILVKILQTLSNEEYFLKKFPNTAMLLVDSANRAADLLTEVRTGE